MAALLQNKSKTTVELYRDLVNVEIRALVHRVAEVSTTVDQIFSMFEDLTIRLEESAVNTEQNRNRLAMAREEINRLSNQVEQQANNGREIFARLKAISLRVQRLEETAKKDDD